MAAGVASRVVPQGSGPNVIPTRRISVPQSAAIPALGAARNPSASDIGRAVYEAITSFVTQINAILDAQPAGRAVLVAGTVTVPSVRVLTTSLIQVWYETTSGTPGVLSVPTAPGNMTARIDNKYFTILSSSGSDTSTVGWKILG